MTAMPARRVPLLGLLLVLTACSYADEKALRRYDADVEPARRIVRELIELQPRLLDTGKPVRIRMLVREEIVPRARRIVEHLQQVETSHPRLRELHQTALSIWSDYARAFRPFADESLDAETLPAERDRLQVALRELHTRWRRWRAELVALHNDIAGWGS